MSTINSFIRDYSSRFNSLCWVSFNNSNSSYIKIIFINFKTSNNYTSNKINSQRINRHCEFCLFHYNRSKSQLVLLFKTHSQANQISIKISASHFNAMIIINVESLTKFKLNQLIKASRIKKITWKNIVKVATMMTRITTIIKSIIIIMRFTLLNLTKQKITQIIIKMLRTIKQLTFTS